jgi:chaperonin GroEL (HSP60 family)
MLEAVPERRPTEPPSESVELLAFDGEIMPPETDRSLVADAGTLAAGTFEDTERRWVSATSERLIESGVDLLVCSGTVDDAVADRLRRAGIDCLTTVSGADMRFLRRMVERDLLRAIEEIEPDRTVPVSLEYDWEAGRTTLTTDDAAAITVLLYSQSEAQRDQLESTMSDAVEVVAQVAYDGRVLPGGGAPELEMARAVDAVARDRDDRSQLAADAFGEALISIPRILLQNAGLDPIDRLHAQQAAHHDGEWFAAVDLETGAVIDARKRGIRETLTVKRHAISVSLDAACMLVRIDGILESEQD